jgi:hypothetical protein
MRETSCRSAVDPIAGSRANDGASATPDQPPASVLPAFTADAAERAEVAKSEAAEKEPSVLGLWTHGELDLPGFTTIRKNFVVERRKRRRSNKPRGPLEDLPF